MFEIAIATGVSMLLVWAVLERFYLNSAEEIPEVIVSGPPLLFEDIDDETREGEP